MAYCALFMILHPYTPATVDKSLSQVLSPCPPTHIIPPSNSSVIMHPKHSFSLISSSRPFCTRLAPSDSLGPLAPRKGWHLTCCSKTFRKDTPPFEILLSPRSTTDYVSPPPENFAASGRSLVVFISTISRTPRSLVHSILKPHRRPFLHSRLLFYERRVLLHWDPRKSNIPTHVH